MLLDCSLKELQVQHDSGNFMRRLPDRTPEVIQFDKAGAELYRERDNGESFAYSVRNAQNYNYFDNLSIPLDALDNPSMISLSDDIEVIRGTEKIWRRKPFNSNNARVHFIA